MQLLPILESVSKSDRSPASPSQAISQSLNMFPFNETYLSNRAAAHLAMGNAKAAIVDAQAAVSSNPSWIKGYIRLGAALSADGQHDSAVSVYKRALKVDPTQTAVSVALGRATVMASVAKGVSPASASAAGAEAAEQAQGEKDNSDGGGEGNTSSPAEDGGDMLAAFLGEVQAAQVAAKVAARKRQFKPGDAAHEIARLLQPHHAWINLDPFGVLCLPPDATEEEIKFHYRRLSAVVHPDKCTLDGAMDAFQALKTAYQTLQDEERREACAQLYREAEEEAEKNLKRLRKRGEEVPPLQEELTREVRRRFAEIERRKRKFEKRLVGKAQSDAEVEAAKAAIEAEDAADEEKWDKTRDSRFNNWQGFKGGGKKRRVGGINNDSLRYGVKAAEAAKASTADAADEKVFKSTWR